MLDENLPAFFLKPSTTGIKHHNEFYLSHHGSDPEPAYHLEHPDPASASPAHKNCYAVALFDSYNPQVLFGEVLARPEWTKSNHTAETPGGIPPPPQPVIPAEFIVQLYNPDQQVKVEVKSGKWGGQDSYEFSMPEEVFRTPSASNLDKGQSDPASLDITPKLNFVWRKDGLLSKDLTCSMTGKSTDKKKKSSRKDPDISVALWRQMRELTIYEPNLTRVEMEDPKGLEVVLLLTAVVIKDIYFSPKDQLRDVFNISDAATPPPAKLSSGGRKVSNPQQQAVLGAPPGPSMANTTHPSLPLRPRDPSNAPPFPDARAQWESEAETARLQAEAQREKAEAQRRRREQEKRDEMERRRLQKMVEEEERAARRRQADVDKETERLRKLYGVTPIPDMRARPQQQQHMLPPRPYAAAPGPSMGSNGLRVPGPSVSTGNVVMSGANGLGSNGFGGPGRPGKKVQKKSSFWR